MELISFNNTSNIESRIDEWIGSPPSTQDQYAIRQLSYIKSPWETVFAYERLVNIYPNQPLLISRLAENYYDLSHLYGASILIRRIMNIMGDMSNVSFKLWCEKIISESDNLEKMESSFYRSPNGLGEVSYSSKLRTLDKYIISEPISVSTTLKLEWDHLITNTSNSQIVEAYARLLCIETNELENVFKVDGNSMMRLVKGGFFVGALTHVDHNSKIKDKENIISILRDVKDALYMIKSHMDSNGNINKELIMAVHATIMKSNRIDIRTNESTGVPHRVIVPINEWRRRTVFAKRYDRKTGKIGAIMFHPFDQIEESMIILDTMMHELTTNKIDQVMPYTLAAWIHHALISIHPFVDGNGRMTRIISSIPLVIAGLPPICISSENKREYFDALREADENFNITPLAEFIAKESHKAIERVKHICNTMDDNINYAYNDDDARTQIAQLFP